MGVVQLIAVGVQGGLARQLHNRVEEVGVVDWPAFVPQRQHSVGQSHRSVVVIVSIIVVVAFEIIFFITPAIFGIPAIIVLAFVVFSVLLVFVLLLLLLLLIVPHLSKDARPEDARLAAVLEDAIEEDPDVVPVEEI